jgi:predicted TIM-barrel enzyme
MMITHGGPMQDVESTSKVMEATEVVGYTCGSSIERTAVEPVVIKISQDFKNMPVNIPKWMNL